MSCSKVFVSPQIFIHIHRLKELLYSAYVRSSVLKWMMKNALISLSQLRAFVSPIYHMLYYFYPITSKAGVFPIFIGRGVCAVQNRSYNEFILPVHRFTDGRNIPDCLSHHKIRGIRLFKIRENITLQIVDSFVFT